MDNLESKQSSRDVVMGVTQETTMDAHEWIRICRNFIPGDHLTVISANV